MTFLKNVFLCVSCFVVVWAIWVSCSPQPISQFALRMIMCHGRPGNPGVAARQEQESRQRSSGLKIHHAATTRGPQYDDSSCDRPAARSMPQQFVIAPRECRAMPQHFVIAPRECRAMPPHFVIAPRECRARQQHFVIAPRGCRAIEGKHSTEGSTIIKQRFGKWRDSCSQVSCFRFQTFNSKLANLRV